MKLYFLRHATAVDEAPSDEERELTKDGRKEARYAGQALEVLGAVPTFVLASPLVRAIQTAELACKGLKSSVKLDPIIVDELVNGTSTAMLLKALKPYSDAEGIVLVGHSPSMADHVANMIGLSNGNSLKFNKGAIACVKAEELRSGRGILQWFLSPKQLKIIADSE